MATNVIQEILNNEYWLQWEINGRTCYGTPKQVLAKAHKFNTSKLSDTDLLLDVFIIFSINLCPIEEQCRLLDMYNSVDAPPLPKINLPAKLWNHTKKTKHASQA